MLSLLIIDGHDAQASTRFQTEIRPGLPKRTSVDVVQGATAAKERLREAGYEVVLVEHMVVEPVSLELPRVDPSDVQQRLDRGEKVSFSLAGLTAANIDNVIRPAYTILPELIALRPKAGYVIVSHGKGVGVGGHLPKYKAFPEVLGVFGWISSKGTSERILELIRSRLR